MSAVPLWFGDESRPLQGWLHTPDDGSARGGVILCPPVGIELVYTGYNLRLLARELESAGFLVVRFDYDGTGQSAGDFNDPGRVSSWLESIGHAAELAREAGADWLAAAGLRLGATLAARAASETSAFDALVLWDPLLSARRFVREQRTLHIAVAPWPDAGDSSGVELPGYLLTEETMADLASLELPAEGSPLAPRVLVLTDPDRPRDEGVARRLSAAGVEWQDCVEDAPIMDLGKVGYEPPRKILEQVASWLSGVCDRELAPLPKGQPGGRGAVTVARSEAGQAIVEEPLALGTVPLFGFVCEARGQGDDVPAGVGPLPTVLFLSVAAESSIGPAREWVELSRRLAADGFRCVRFDLSGAGESPTRPGCVEHDIYAPHHLADIDEAVRSVSPDDPGNVILVGICSGAYAALVAAPRLRPRAIVVVNPILTHAAFHKTPSIAVPRSPRLARWLLVDAMVGRLRAATLAAGDAFRGANWRVALAQRLPPRAWRLVYGLGLAHSPERLLAPVVEAQVPTLLICGSEEAEAPRLRTPKALERLVSAERCGFAEIPRLNHSLLHYPSRLEARQLVVDYMASIIDATAVEGTVDSADSVSRRLSIVPPVEAAGV